MGKIGEGKSEISLGLPLKAEHTTITTHDQVKIVLDRPKTETKKKKMFLTQSSSQPTVGK